MNFTNLYKQPAQSKAKKQLGLLRKGALHYLWTMFLLVVIGGAGNAPTTPAPIVLRTEALSFTPKEYYIAGLIDEREDKEFVAWLLPLMRGKAQAANLQGVDLQGGAESAIAQFIAQSLPRNTSLRPIIIRLKECKIAEAPAADGRVEGNVMLDLSFELQKEGGESVRLTTYRGGVRYLRAPNRYSMVEPAFRQSLKSALKYLNNWMEHEGTQNISLVKGTRVVVKDYMPELTKDTVYYSVRRPLQWDDFRAAPRAGHYAASIFSNFAYKSSSKIVDGYVELELLLKVYMLKNSSWVKSGERDAYGLRHEQNHFNITKLVAERFKQKVMAAAKENPEDIDGILGYQYIESYREMNRLQEQYDQETQHGINREAQERWNRYIQEELRSVGINP